MLISEAALLTIIPAAVEIISDQVTILCYIFATIEAVHIPAMAEVSCVDLLKNRRAVPTPDPLPMR